MKYPDDLKKLFVAGELLVDADGHVRRKGEPLGYACPNCGLKWPFDILERDVDFGCRCGWVWLGDWRRDGGGSGGPHEAVVEELTFEIHQGMAEAMPDVYGDFDFLDNERGDGVPARIVRLNKHLRARASKLAARPWTKRTRVAAEWSVRAGRVAFGEDGGFWMWHEHVTW